MNLFERAKENMWRRRDNLIRGGVNCIPWGLPRFEEFSPGIEQRNYYLVSANAKVGKSQITDFMFMHNAYSFFKQMDGEIDLKIFYFSLEMSDEQKIVQCLSHRLFVDSGKQLRLTPKQLRNTREALPAEIVEQINNYTPYFEEFLDHVTFITDIGNPYGVWKYMKEYALANGTQHKKIVEVTKANDLGVTTTEQIEMDDYYEPNNPNEYVIILLDHASNLSTEKGAPTIREAIQRLSGKHFIKLRNKYGYIPVLIQQQASAQESIENFKINKLKPSFNGLADCKDTQRDIDLALGLFTPARHEIPTYQKYNIKYFKDNIRFLGIMGAREGGGGITIPLYFDGAVNYFSELPRVSDIENMQRVYNRIASLRGTLPLNYSIPN